MKLIVNKYTKEVVHVALHAEFAGKNIDLGGSFLGGAEHLEIHERVTALPEDFTPMKYLYENGSLKLNPTYIVPEDAKAVKEMKELLAEQDKKIKSQDDAINQLIVDSLMGGL